ncbi:MAG: TIGR03915 family putative DNA repair protein [Acetobacter orientalis]
MVAYKIVRPAQYSAIIFTAAPTTLFIVTMQYRVVLADHASFTTWRAVARECFLAGLQPEAIEWRTLSAEASLFEMPTQLPRPMQQAKSPVLRSACLNLLKSILRHSDPARFNLAYRILWRAQKEPALAQVTVDPDVARALRMDHQIRRDVHKMEAFVRFRECSGVGANRRQFLAWFDPEHYILHAVAPFFSKRFTDMDWVILTPKGSISWDGECYAVKHTPCQKPEASDEIDVLWQTYYVSIFNPARIKIKAMRSEMPRKYWKNLPETRLIPHMLAQAEKRVAAMAAQMPQAPPEFHKRLQAKNK